jgi:O-antigen ligase
VSSSALSWQQRRTGLQTQSTAVGENPWPFRLVLLSLIFEFGRPQEIIPGIKVIPFSSILNALIALSVVTSGRLSFRNHQTKLWLPLLGLMVIHTPLAINNFSAAMTLKDMALLFCLYLGLITFVNTFQKFQTLMTIWLGLHVVTSALGIASGGTGVGGWMGDENDFCMAINMVIPFAFFMMYTKPSAAQKAKYVGLLALYIFTVMVTLSRGGFIGMTAAGIYSWFRSPMKIGSVFLIILLMLFMAAAAPDKYWDEVKSSFTEEEMETGTGRDRTYIWAIGFEMFLANPIVGVGQGNFPWTFGEYEAGRTLMGRSRAGREAHSLYFTLMPEMGIVGIGIFVAMLIFCKKDIKIIERIAAAELDASMNESVHKDNKIALLMSRAMEGSMIGFLVSSVFISTLWYPSFWVMMGFIVTLRNLTVAKAVGSGIDVDRIIRGEGSRIPHFRQRQSRVRFGVGDKPVDVR